MTGDADWLQQRRKKTRSLPRSRSMNCTWDRGSAREGGRFLSYREVAPRLCEYVKRMGFTHVELLPIMEHPFYGSWGYQCTGFLRPPAATDHRKTLCFLSIRCTKQESGVILDWVPSHFPADSHGLGFFDGTHLYEHADPRQGFHPEWHSLCSTTDGTKSARFCFPARCSGWTATTLMDCGLMRSRRCCIWIIRARKEWIPNRQGGKENLDAISFLRQLSEDVYREFPDCETIAEESTSWPLVSRPTSLGGLGFLV